VRVVLLEGGWIVAGVLFCLFGTRGAAAGADAAGYRPLDAQAYLLFLLAPALLAFVWRWPRAVLAATTVLVATYLARDYPGGPIYLVTVTAAAMLGWAQPLRRALPVVAATSVALVAAAAVHVNGASVLASTLSLLTWSLVPVIPWALTSLVRINRASTRQAAVQAHRHQIDEERIRIAREVHDVVGHSLAVISLQAGVALHVGQRRPEQTQVALQAIARSSRDALAELRGTLAVLRGEAPALESGPGIDDLAVLVAEFTATGQHVHLSVTDRPEGLPASHELAVYRIVQESLTNAARHAGAPPTLVVVACTARDVTVDVCDEGPCGTARDHATGSPSRGSGLTGMHERCDALGGTLEAGRRREGGWRVHAVLPYQVVGA